MGGLGLGLGLSLGLGGGRSGGAATAQAATVGAAATGTVYTITRLLGGSSTLALIAGTNGNLTLSGANIQATAALGNGVSQTAEVRESMGAIAIEYPVVLTGAEALAAVLNALALSSSAGTVGTAATVAITGATAGSVITGTPPDGMTLNGAARTINDTPTAAGSYSLILTETLGTATNSPRSTTLPFTVAAAVAPVLSALSLAASSVVENSAAGVTVGGVLGRTAGSTLSLVDTAGGRFALSGTNIVTGATSTDYEAATSHAITIREALAGATNNPLDTVLTITVSNAFEQPSLAALGLSATALILGAAASGAITGATAGSAIVATGLPTGLTINGPTRTWAWSGTGFAGSSTFTLTETLADSANSPKGSTVAVTISAAASTLPQTSAIVSRFRSDALPPVADGALVDTWTDMIDATKSVTATGAARPTYKVNRFGGKPSLLFGGAQYLAGTVSAANTALSAGECSMMVVYANAQATSFGFLASLTNSTGFNVSHNGSGAGVSVSPLVDSPPTGFATGMYTVTQNYAGLGAARSPFYVNGQTINVGVSTAFAPTSLGIGGSATGIGIAKAEILEVIVWNRRLTAYEALQAEIAVRDYYTQPYPWASSPYIYIATGDSLTEGLGLTDKAKKTWPRLLATANALPVGAWANHGYVGANPGTINSIINSERLKDVTTLTGKPVKISYFEFYNQRGVALATAVANTQAVLSNVRGVPGNKIAFGTTTDYGNPPRGSEKSAWTSYWDTASNRAGYMDAYVPIHNDPNIGVDGACPSAAPFGHYFRSTQGQPLALTGATIAAGSATLTTTNDVLTVGVYINDARLPVDTYVTTKSSAGNYTLNNPATTAISNAGISAATLLKGDGIHYGDDGAVVMGSLFGSPVATM